MSSYLRMDVLRLPTNVGASSTDGFRVSTGQAGALSFGPYASLNAGRYIAGFYVRRLGAPEPGNIVLDVCVEKSMILASKSIAHQNLFEDLASFVYLPFDLSGPVSLAEVRIHVDEGVLIELRELLIFTADQRAWGVS